MKETVLEIVQSCMSEMNSDNINSIDDTTEAQRVALMLKDVYLELSAFRDWPSHKKQINLDSSGDASRPNYLKLPDAVQETYYIRYDCKKTGETRTQWRTLEYMYPDEFIYHVNQRNNDNDNVDVITDWDGTELNIINDQAPQYWTSFDDDYIVTDAYDSAVDTTLQSTKSTAYVLQEPTITLTDSFVVDLPTDAFAELKIVLKERAFENVKQMPSRSVSVEAQRQRNRMSRKSWRAKGGVRYPNYGRVNGKSVRNPTFKQDRN